MVGKTSWDDCVRNVRGILRRHKGAIPIKSRYSVSVEHKFRRQGLALQPFNGLWSGIKCMDLQTKSPDQREIERNVLSHANRINNT